MTFNLLLMLSPILQKFSQIVLDVTISYPVYKILKEVQEELIFYRQEEEKLVETYAEGINEKGEVLFSNEGKKQMFLNEIEKLQNTEVTLKNSKIQIPLKSIEKIQLSPSDFYLLENIIDFVGEGNIENG